MSLMALEINATVKFGYVHWYVVFCEKQERSDMGFINIIYYINVYTATIMIK